MDNLKPGERFTPGFLYAPSMDKKRDHNWEAIKAEYITTTISYRKLADKWGISFRTLADRAGREGWAEERNKHRNNVVKKTIQKVTAKTSTDAAEKLLRLQKSADNMSEVIERVFNDNDQFHRHIVQTRDGNLWDAEERVYDKVDTKAIKDLAGALKDLAYVMRNVYDLPTKQEQSAMDIAADRLRLEQRKADADTPDGDEAGVVELAPVMDGDGDE